MKNKYFWYKKISWMKNQVVIKKEKETLKGFIKKL